MEWKSQRKGVLAETGSAFGHHGGQRTGLSVEAAAAPRRLPASRPAEAMSDLDYARFMEARYGIRDEGAF